MAKLIELDYRSNSAICKVTGEKPLLWSQNVGFTRGRVNCVHCGGGDNDYISYDNIKDLMAVGTGDFTFVTWFRHFKTGYPNSYFSIIGGGYLAATIGVGLFYNDILNKLNFQYRLAPITASILSDEDIKSGEWYCVVCYRKNGIGYMELNGVQQISTVSTTINLSAIEGEYFMVGANGQPHYEGKVNVSYFAFYNEALESQQRRQIYNDFKNSTQIYYPPIKVGNKISENFKRNGADGKTINLPRGWIYESGAYKIEELSGLKNEDLSYSLDFTDSWGVLGGGNVTDSNTITCSSVGGLQKTNIIEVGVFYKLKIQGSIVGGATFELRGFSSVGTYLLTNDLTFDETIYFEAQSSGFYFRLSTSSVLNVYVFEIEQVIPNNMKNKIKYLECVTDGSVKLQSNQAFGTWEFDLYKGGESNIINIRFVISDNQYFFQINNLERIAFYKSSPLVILGNTDNGYVSNYNWYTFKITREANSSFAFYIKGGSFGSTFQLIDFTYGTNPIVDSDFNECDYFTVDIDSGDRIANIKIY